MSCKQWELEISAFVDGCLDDRSSAELRSHLQQCRACAALLEELQKVNSLVFESLPDITPPAGIWTRLESQIRAASNPPPSRWRWRELLQIPKLPRFAYGMAVVLVLVLVLFVAVDLKETSPTEKRYLAELDAYTLESEGNPFLPAIRDGNPFFAYEGVPADNPFAGGRSVEK